MHDSFWVEAINIAVYILNQSYTKMLKGITPQEAYSGKKPLVMHFRMFGCFCYAHVPDSIRRKLDAKSRKCIFLGYSEESKAYQLYDPKAKKIVTSRDVVFAEQPHSAENVGSFATSSTNEIVHLVPPQRPEEGKEE